ncbi:hypothetical protein KIN20_027813 [Parelaphostrongylus tenuis]|uniref:Uncharacterized protein n=1 Tax=Parelaphostrongylus tenuis TaxID=148309 RepID=A0AAD5R054_PARTN|nr:hypothetical protein KIN20_027813 [Parelaphostrongylus tenuis]
MFVSITLDRKQCLASSSTTFQLLFTPLGPDGIHVLPFYRLNIYNSSAMLSLLLNVFGFLLIIFVFEERYDVLDAVKTKVSGALF